MYHVNQNLKANIKSGIYTSEVEDTEEIAHSEKIQKLVKASHKTAAKTMRALETNMQGALDQRKQLSKAP